MQPADHTLLYTQVVHGALYSTFCNTFDKDTPLVHHIKLGMLTCLSIGKNADIVAVHDAGDHRLHISKDSFLAAAGIIHSIITVTVALGLG